MTMVYLQWSHSISFITALITDRIGLHLILLSLCITIIIGQLSLPKSKTGPFCKKIVLIVADYYYFHEQMKVETFYFLWACVK